MGRSKLTNNKQAKQLMAAQERNVGFATNDPLARSDKCSNLGAKQRGKLVRDTRRPAGTENNWLHGVLFVVIAGIIVAWALGY